MTDRSEEYKWTEASVQQKSDMQGHRKLFPNVRRTKGLYQVLEIK